MVCCSAVLSVVVLPAHAGILDYTASSGTLDSQATFTASGSNLLVTLTNTSPDDVLVPSDILTAVFFDLAGDPTLAPVSALLPSGSTVFFGPASGGNVGGEWAYAAGLSGAPGSTTSGISSTGLGLFGAGNFGGPNLQGPAAVDGLQYGLTSAGDDTTSGNQAVTGKNALIKDSVQFTLSGLPSGFDPRTQIGDVWFQYGTCVDEPSFGGRPPEVPELPAAALGLVGLVALAVGKHLLRRPG